MCSRSHSSQKCSLHPSRMSSSRRWSATLLPTIDIRNDHTGSQLELEAHDKHQLQSSNQLVNAAAFHRLCTRMRWRACQQQNAPHMINSSRFHCCTLSLVLVGACSSDGLRRLRCSTSPPSPLPTKLRSSAKWREGLRHTTTATTHVQVSATASQTSCKLN